MTPAIEHNLIAVILYWAMMAPIAAFILHVVAGFCTDDYPTSFHSALFMVLVTAAAVFFTFDISGYVFALFMRDPTVGVQMPANYSYWDWLREPLAVKWQVLGFMPFIRYLPIFFALIIGCIVQVFMWKVEFKLGAVVFIAQVVLTIAAMALLSVVFRFGLEYYEHYFPVKDQHKAGEAKAPARKHLKSEPAHLDELNERVQRMGDEGTSIWRQIDGDWDSANRHLQPLYDFMQPVTKHLPHPAQSFLNAGGWILVLVGAGGFVLFWPKIRRHRKEALRPRSKRKHFEHIKLAMIGDSVTALGPRQATVHGVPARLRVLVMTPAARITGKAAVPAPLATFLDSIRPELSAITAADFPHVEVWSDQHAREHFRKTVETRIEFPEPSSWVVLVGETTWAGSPAHIALGFLTLKPVESRIEDIPAGQWPQAIGIRDVPKEERD
jgi:hypothetical protein